MKVVCVKLPPEESMIVGHYITDNNQVGDLGIGKFTIDKSYEYMRRNPGGALNSDSDPFFITNLKTYIKDNYNIDTLLIGDISEYFIEIEEYRDSIIDKLLKNK